MSSHRPFNWKVIGSDNVPVGTIKIQFNGIAAKETIDGVPQTAFDPESLGQQVWTEIAQHLDRKCPGFPLNPPEKATVYVHTSAVPQLTSRM